MLKKGNISYQFISILGFPVSLTLFTLISWQLFTLDPGLSVVLYFLILRVIAAIFCLSFEYFIPFDKAQPFEKNELKTDTFFYITNNFLLVPAIAIFHISLCFWVIEALDYQHSFSLSSLSIYWEIIIGFLLMEYLSYWAHRLVHTQPLLWRGHATHHSPTSMYWLNNFRNNLLSYLVAFALVYTPMYLLGISKEFLIFRFSIFILLAPYQHINADFKMGFFNYIFSAAPNHRFHHSKNPKQANANFGLMVVIFDILHGTFINGDKYDKKIKMGLFSEVKGYKKHDFVFQELAPYRSSLWKKTLVESKRSLNIPTEQI
ncbi:sterol desaturase family protein [Shewanella surugensis]|uniref:Sterol desaturase family protein n=1 Tax=Shewanella surugensis TaxID=212020 RepID=A0ABT0LC34_9GAMM|nr:sterol desaturase family protein [Shewanella surugensis]MCL1125070.1 sterol desaturase family protein [Shewanella surugensis]